jgi:sirohydrochlorin ferrochelatase
VKTGLIIVDHGSRRAESNQTLERLAELFAARFGQRFSIVEPAHMELAEPTIERAYGRCVGRGASMIICLPWFLADGRHWTRDIPSLLSQAATKHPGTRFQLAEPLGIDDLMLELMFKRATAETQPIYQAGEIPESLIDVEPTRRREQCTSCPFEVRSDGTICRKTTDIA